MNWRRWLQRDDREANLDRELSFHIEERVADMVRSGVSEEDARRRVRLEFGAAERVTEECRDVRPARWAETFLRDIRYAWRNLRRNPGFAAVAIATLALGIGGLTAMFSAFDTILIRPLPYADPDRLVMVWDDLSKSDDRTKSAPAPAEWFEWRRLNTVFTDLASTQPTEATLSGDAAPEQVPARKATGNLWSVLGVKPLIGRVFNDEEDRNGARVAVISYGLWQRRYGGSPDVLGRKIDVNDTPYEVIGVLPREFYFLPARDIDLWMPASFPAWMRTAFGWHDEEVVARLKTGVTREQAERSMAALSLQLTAKAFPRPHRTVVTSLREDITGKTQTALVVLLAASAALLLIACVNLANLLMSRGLARSREVAVRVALGAGRGRLAAQFLTESLVLAGLGALAGLALALPAMRFLARLVPETMGPVRLTLDWRVLAFSAAAAIAAALAFGLAPALRGSRTGPQDGLHEGGRGAAGARSYWFQHSLIVIETALAVALLTSGGLLLETFRHLRNTDLGVRREKLLTFETPLFRYKKFDRRDAFLTAVLEKIRAIPGVINAGATSQLPLKPNDASATFYWIAGQPRERIRDQVALIRLVTRDYFPTIGARLREGRFFEVSDRRSDAQVAIVNETFANRNFAGRSAIGAQFKFGNTGDKGYWYRIVGVVKEIHEVGMEEATRPAVYLLHEQGNNQLMIPPGGIAVRTAVEPASIVSAIRQAMWSIDKNQPMWRVQTLEDIFARQLTTPTQSTALMGAFALLALLLASVGLYGVLSYAVTQRTSEIGVRMALGATSREILLTFGKRGLVLTVAGLAIGLGLSTVASRFLSALLYGFRPDLIPTITVVSLVLLGVAALACLAPARRASRVDPVVALRSE
jgi:putative ABC transport system permease protein